MAILVYDYETTSVDPNTTQPVQLAACIIDEVTLNINHEDIFNTHIQPSDWTGIDENNENVLWHAKNRKCNASEIIHTWKESPSIEQVWPSFVQYCLKYNKTKNKWGAPVRAGCNIIKFDDIITERMHTKYGKGKVLFHPRDAIDLILWFYSFFENDPEIKSYSLDNMRSYFGMSKDNAHDAKQDILDCAQIIVRFMKLFRATAKKTKFKGAFANVEL